MLGLVLLAGGVAFLLLVAALGLFQRRLIYLPVGQPGTPGAAGLPSAREVSYTTEDGERLAGWFLPTDGPRPAPAVLFLPGNAGNRSYRAPLAAALADAGLAVLLVDYRGYAGNPGQPSEQGLAADARAALSYLLALPEVDPARIVVFGESLGTGVAVTLAAERPAAALILRSPFSSLTAVARIHYPFLPVRWLLQDRFESIDRIASVGCPVLVLAGERDRLIPVEESRRLFEAAVEPKHLALIPGARHNDLALLAGPQALDEIRRFLEEAGVLRPRRQ
ncbi:MAG: alpha/beta hydrolase [Acidobacteria bacterium]|nr:alpha/beta hydrolase [Acidobacteriota bacterium]